MLPLLSLLKVGVRITLCCLTVGVSVMEEIKYCTNKDYCTCGKDDVSIDNNICNCKCCKEERSSEQEGK